MNKHLLYLILFIATVQVCFSQEHGVVALDLPVRNSLKFNRYVVNPTFSFVREQNKVISFSNKRQWVQFDDAPQAYLFSYSGRFGENIGAGIGLFQQDFGVQTTFGGMLNFAYNAVLNRDNNLTFGLNIGAYQSGINEGRVITNFPDPALQNIPKQFLLTVNPGINYGTAFFDFGLSINNLVSYNLNASKLIEDNPEQGLQAHVMYTGYMNSRGFFDESKFSTLIRSEFKKETTVISALAMLTIPKGIWGQAGYNTLYGVSASVGLNVSDQIAVEYNYEQSIGELSGFGNSHEFTVAYRFKNYNRYVYSGDDDEKSVFATKSKKRTIAKRRPTNSKPKSSTPRKPRTEAAKDAINKPESKEVAEVPIEEPKNENIAVATNENDKANDQIKEVEEAESIAQAEKDRLALEKKAEAEAKVAAEAKAREEARLKAEAERKAAQQEEARIKAEELRRQQAAEAEKKAKLEEERRKAEAARLEEARLKAEELKRQQEAEAKALEESRLRAEAEKKAQLEEEKRKEAAAKLEAERLRAEELKRQEDARLKAEAEEKARLEEEKRSAEAERLKAEESEKAGLEAEEAARAKEIAELSKLDEATKNSINEISQSAETSKEVQKTLIDKLTQKVAIKQKDLDDLKEENDLSEKGIYVEPKPFKSVTAENAEIETLKEEIDKVIEEQRIKIEELEAVLVIRRRKVRDDSDPLNAAYLKSIEELKTQLLNTMRIKADLEASLENIMVATEVERRRRIKRAAYDNQKDRFAKDSSTLEFIKKFTDLSSKDLTVDDFDFGEKRGGNIQIVKNVSHAESGYYVVLAIHDDEAKRDEFLSQVVSTGNKDINFFFDVNTNKYFIYQKKFDDILEAQRVLLSDNEEPYNARMSIVKIEN